MMTYYLLIHCLYSKNVFLRENVLSFFNDFFFFFKEPLNTLNRGSTAFMCTSYILYVYAWNINIIP